MQGFIGGERRTRTADTSIFSRVLYQLSYLAATPDPSVSGPSNERCEPDRRPPLGRADHARPLTLRARAPAPTSRAPGRSAAREHDHGERPARADRPRCSRAHWRRARASLTTGTPSIAVTSAGSRSSRWITYALGIARCGRCPRGTVIWILAEEYLHTDTDRVVAVGAYRGTVRATGAPLDAAFAHLLRIDDGKIRELVQITDTASWGPP
jgi:hypothetical protein